MMIGKMISRTIQTALANPLDSRLRKMSAMTENSTIRYAKKRYATKINQMICQNVMTIPSELRALVELWWHPGRVAL
jgi:hypothetical protein